MRYVLIMPNNKCDICELASVRAVRDDAGDIFRACMRHAKHLAEWVRESNYAAFLDRLAARNERAAYGDD